MTEWIIKKTMSIAAIVGIIVWVLFVGNIVYQTYRTYDINDFKEVRITTKEAGVGEVVNYEVEYDKKMPLQATIVRQLVSDDGGSVNIVPDLSGNAKVGHHTNKNFLIVPDKTPPKDYRIRTTYTYSNVNPYHDPVVYVKDSKNTFRVKK